MPKIKPKPKKRIGGYHRQYQMTSGMAETRESMRLDRGKRLIDAAFEVWRLKNGVDYP